MKRRYYILIIFILLLTGCATCFPDLKIAQAEQQGRIYRGMTLSQVESIVGRQPVCFYGDHCRTEHLSDGDYFVWIVGGGQGGNNFARTYTFRFKDNQLVNWGNN